MTNLPTLRVARPSDDIEALPDDTAPFVATPG